MRFPRMRPRLITILALDAWVVLALWLVPKSIRAAFASDGASRLTALITGSSTVGDRLHQWYFVVRVATFWMVTLGLTAWLALRAARWLREHPIQTPGPTAPGRLAPLYLALWFGLVSGVGEGYYIAMRTVLIGRPADWAWTTNANTALLAPVAQVATFTTLALGFLIVARFRPGLRTHRSAFLAFVTLTVLGWILVTKRIHPMAGAALAAGAAIQSWRLLGPRLMAFVASARRSFVRGATLVGLLFLIRAGFLEGRARVIRGALASPAGSAPNVLLIVMDTQRALDMARVDSSASGESALVPLARSSIVFEHAVAPSSWTFPSHASLFTGLPAHAVVSYPLDDRRVTLAEVLRARGYDTAGFVANIFFLNRAFGLAQGFSEWVGTPLSWRSLGISGSWIRLGRRALRKVRGEHDYLLLEDADRVNRRLLRWIDRRPADRPFFAFVNYFDVHEPYDPRAGYLAEPLDPDLPDWLPLDSLAQSYPPDWIHGWRVAYESESDWLASRIGMLFDSLAERGLLENTVIVLTSDHGEQFGEHGLLEHSNSLYRPVIDVPLMIRLPGGRSGSTRIGTPVTISDIGATILDLAGAADAAFPGRSLAPAWTSGSFAERPILSSLQGQASIVFGGFHYISRDGGREELYDLSDPDETDDLAGLPAAAPSLRALRALADSARRAAR